MIRVVRRYEIFRMSYSHRVYIETLPAGPRRQILAQKCQWDEILSSTKAISGGGGGGGRGWGMQGISARI